MEIGVKLNKRIAVVMVTLGFVAIIVAFLACAPPQKQARQMVTLPVSSWGENYSYSYEPPEKRPPASVKITVAIVSPIYGGKQQIEPAYSKVAAGLQKSLAIDLDKIIIAKGMTVTGPFENLDMMTYPDKKNADLSLTPEFFVNPQSRDTSQWIDVGSYFKKAVEVKVDAWVALMLREPLSSEKIWIKKVEVGEETEQAEIYAQKVDRGPVKPGSRLHNYGLGEFVYDGRKDAVANILKKMYPGIMQTVWKYINTDEILVLKDKSQEIRKLKRY